MSELIQKSDNRATIRWKLLTGASAFALMAYVSSATIARSEDADRPTIWLDLGGQMEQVQGTYSPFTAPFMTAVTPTPGPYANDIFIRGQQPPRIELGFEGQITFQPSDSDWLVSAAVRYGRAKSDPHEHQQSPPVPATFHGTPWPQHIAAFADAETPYKQSNTILDFAAGRDVGVGVLGRDSVSTINAGVRLAQFSVTSDTTERARPSVQILRGLAGLPIPTFYAYTMFAHAERSFRGVGPSLSWNASAPIAGSRDDGELTLDWSINGAVLFGRQKAKTNHTTQAYHMPFTFLPTYVGYHYTRIYQKPHPHTRSRNVTVPNLGGLVGLSVKYPNVKFSIGYRADFFFGAVDAGIDQRQAKNLGFNGPFASISIGLGD